MGHTGYLSEAKIGEQLFTLYRADEKEKKANFKTNPCHLLCEGVTTQETQKTKEGRDEIKPNTKKENQQLMVCALDSPGHLDYSPEVAAGLRMADGVCITVSATDGVSTMLEYLIKDSVTERCKPVAFVNKLDISIMTLQQS